MIQLTTGWLLALMLFAGQAFAQTQGEIITIVDKNGNALAGAEILIGQAVDDPFIGNFVTTNDFGEADIPLEWDPSVHGDLPITINAPGYIRRTFFGQMPGTLRFSMEMRELDNRIELAGKTTDFGPLKRDGYINFGLVIPGLTRGDMLTFDIGRVISPEIDTISVAGQQVDMPSNITLPRQRETYFIPITFNKPRYRTYYSYADADRVFAIHGKFELRKVVGKLRNGEPFINVINDIEMLTGSMNDISLTPGGNNNQSLPVRQHTFGNPAQLTAGDFHSDNVMLALALNEVDGYLFPSDLKTLESGETVSLKTAPIGEQYLLRAVQPRELLSKNNSDERPLTAIFDKANSRTTRDLVDFVGQPSLTGDQVTLDTPVQNIRSNNPTTPLGTIVTLSDIEVRDSGNIKVEIKRRNWELYSYDWQSGIQLPTWPGSFTPMAPDNKERLEVVFLGGDDVNVDLGPEMTQNTTHVIYNKRDL